MNITYKNARRNFRKFQEGGEMQAPDQQAQQEEVPQEEVPQEEVPQDQGGGDPLMQIAHIFSQGLQNQDCQALAQGAQMFLQLLQQQGGGSQPQQGEPVFRKGGKLAYRIRK